MKKRNHQNVLVVAVNALRVANIAVLAKALHCARAAKEDERNHFPYTAAMEWRLAAGLCSSNTFAAEYCWRQWERIMQLPRRLAGAVTDSRTPAVQVQPILVMRREIENSISQISWAVAT